MKDKIIAYLEELIRDHDEMSMSLRREGKHDRAQAWTAGSVALEEALDHIKNME